MIWRVILVWLLGLCVAVADLPRHASVASVSSCEALLVRSYTYDNAWRLQAIDSPAGPFNYTFGGVSSASPLPQSLQLPNGATIAYTYDTLARLTNTALATYWGQIVDAETCVRDPLGLPTNITRNLGLTANTITPTYDAISEVTGWLGAENGTNRLNEQLKYQYDAAGNLITRTNNALVQTFTVDTLNQISTVSRTGSFTFTGAIPEPADGISVNNTAATQYSDLTFAAPGLTLANGSNPFTIAATNKYGLTTNSSFTANLPSTVNYAYDANGNLTNDGLKTFQFDAENQLTNVSIPSQWQTVFVYDALNRRRVESNCVWQSGAWLVTNVTRFLYDGTVPIEELNATNGLLVTYTRGLDLSLSLGGAGGVGGLLARTDSNGSAFYHTDLNGNVTTLMDQNQHVVARYEYDPYGKLLGQWGSYAAANRYLFSSKERILPANLYYYGARFYDPNLARWLNQDPIGEAGGANLYGFVGNNALRYVDPLGFINADRFEELAQEMSQQTGQDYFAGPNGELNPNEAGLQSTDFDFLPFAPELPIAGQLGDAMARAAGEAAGNAVADALEKMGLGKPEIPDAAVSCPSGYPRVKPKKGFGEKVWERNMSPDGRVYDPSGREIKPGDPWELGHTPGNKFSDAQQRAAQEGWDAQTWRQYQQDPDIYRPELPSSNASHRYEDDW